MVIVYCSKTGHTKRYAEMLAARLSLRAYSLNEAKSKIPEGEEVIFMSWLIAGTIKSLRKSRRYSVAAVAAVGIQSPREGLAEEIRCTNKLGTTPVFYLPGGYDRENVTGIDRLLMRLMEKAVVSAAAKADHPMTDAEKRDVETFQHGADFVSEENLSGIVKWYSEHVKK